MRDSEPQLSANQNSTEETSNSRYLLGFLLLMCVSLIFGSSFPVMKEVVKTVSPTLQSAVRYAIAAIFFAPFLRNLNWPLVGNGVLIGITFFLAPTIVSHSLEDISASRGGFTFALSIVLVTLFELFLGKRISAIAILSAILAFAGIALISWQSGEPAIGDVWMIVAALLDSACIIAIERSLIVHPPIQLATVGFWTAAILGLVWSAPELADGWTAIEANLGGLLYLGIVATAFTFSLEIVAQQWVSGNEVAITRTLEPLSAAVFSFWFLGETFTLYDYLGSGMVLSAIVLLVLFKKKVSGDSPTNAPSIAKIEEQPNPQP